MFLDYAERQARRLHVMYMQDWVEKLYAFLQFNDEDILHNKGKVTHEIAKAFAKSEFKQYKAIQNSIYKSDFDKFLEETEQKNK